MNKTLPACPVEVTLQLIGDKWKLLILRELLEEKHRFGELRKALFPITQKVLTSNLRAMEDDGLLTRTIYAEVPPRVEYELTAIGESLKDIMMTLAQWGEDYQKTAALRPAVEACKQA